MPLSRSILYASGQNRFRRASEFVDCYCARGSAVHIFEDLKQAPTLPLITLRVQDSFPFEVNIIDKRVAALWRARQSLELLLNVRALSRSGFCQHFRQRIL